MNVRLGIDVACRADHQASLAGVDGEFIWSGWRFRTTPADLRALWDKIPAGAEVQVILEPTRNAWVPLAAWLSAQGAEVVLVAPEQSADLRDYYNKHTKTDRLDSRVLARLPLLHPEGLQPYDGPTPADPLRRVMRRRAKLVKARVATFQRIDALVELLGPAWAEVIGAGDYTKTALVVLERYGDPRALRRLGQRRLAELMIRTSKGAWREAKAGDLLAAAADTIELWAGGGIDFAELAADIAAEVRVARSLNDEIAELEARMVPLFAAADRRPAVDDGDERGIIASVPGLGGVLGAGILARFGDLDRFANLAGVRSFTGLVPKSRPVRPHPRPQRSHQGRRPRPARGALPRRRLPASRRPAARRPLPPPHRRRPASTTTRRCATSPPPWPPASPPAGADRERYVLRDVDGTPITYAEGRAIVAERYKIPDDVRQARRRASRAKQLKQRTTRRRTGVDERRSGAGSSRHRTLANTSREPLDIP